MCFCVCHLERTLQRCTQTVRSLRVHTRNLILVEFEHPLIVECVLQTNVCPHIESIPFLHREHHVFRRQYSSSWRLSRSSREVGTPANCRFYLHSPTQLSNGFVSILITHVRTHSAKRFYALQFVTSRHPPSKPSRHCINCVLFVLPQTAHTMFPDLAIVFKVKRFYLATRRRTVCVISSLWLQQDVT